MTHLDSDTATRHDYEAAVTLARRAAETYYGSDRLDMGDDDYDALVAAIAAVEALHPTWGDFAGQVAGGVGSGDVTHSRPMLSLANLFDDDELTRWLAGIAHTVGGPVGFVVEPKFDGLAITARYVAGRLVQVATRGDGLSGEDVTRNAGAITGLPMTLHDPLDVEVRGEVYMTDEGFTAANDLRLAAGESAFANPRNATAGTLRVKTPRPYNSCLTFCAYDADYDAPTYTAVLDVVCAAGVATYDGRVVTSDPTEVVTAMAAIRDNRATLGFGVDGAVVKVDDRAVQAVLGANSRVPRWATACKFPAELAMTRLIDIEVQVGRTGVQTPRAVLEPVEVGGVTVTYATLSNPGQVAAKDVRIGDVVYVRRAGEVIPEITGPVLSRRSKGLKRWVAPTTCARCGGALDTSEARWRCQERTCGLREQLIYWCSRDCLDIEGAGPAFIDAVIDARLVGSIADLYRLTATQVAALEGYAEKSAEGVVAAITASRSQPLARVFCGLGVRLTGRSMSRRIAAHFGTLDAIRAATPAEFAIIQGVGEVRAESITAELAEIGGLLDDLVALEVDGSVSAGPPVAPSGEGEGSLPLDGKRVCVSGAVPGLNRNEANEAVERLGGTAVSSVSATCDLLVTDPASTTSKAAKARSLGVAIMDPTEFASLAGVQQ